MNHRNPQVPPQSGDEQALEQTLQEKGLTAPRLTPAQIDATIAGEAYHVLPGTQLTVCVLTLRNGFTVTGEGACASPENFDEQVGRDIARRNARDKIWALEGYLLKQALHEQAKSGLRFGQAIAALKLGAKATRAGWNGKGMWVALQSPDDFSKMRRPYIYLKPIDGTLVPWLAGHSDVLADDWMIVEE